VSDIATTARCGHADCPGNCTGETSRFSDLVYSLGPHQKKKQSGGCFLAVGYRQCCIEVAVIRRGEDHLNDAIRAGIQSGWTFVGLGRRNGPGYPLHRAGVVFRSSSRTTLFFAAWTKSTKSSPKLLITTMQLRAPRRRQSSAPPRRRSITRANLLEIVRSPDNVAAV
jgi:hypothetical protein